MKFLIVTAALVAVALAGPAYHPIQVGPAIVEDFHPVDVGPAIVEDSPIHVGPVLVDESSPVQTLPALVEDHVSTGSVASGSPLVQIIVNVNKNNNEVSTADHGVNDLPVSPIQVVEEAPIIPVLPSPIEIPSPIIIDRPIIPVPQ